MLFIDGENIMKRITVLILILLSLLSFWVISVFKNKDVKNIEIIYADESVAINRVCEFDNTYYYAGKQGIYSNNKCVLNTNGNSLIYSNNSTLFVYADKEITGYDKSFSQICKYKLQNEAKNFAVSGSELFYIDTVGKYHVLDKATLEDKKESKSEKIKGNIIIYHYTDFLICEDSTNCSISAFFDNNVVSSVKDYSEHFGYLSDNCLIHTSATNTNTINLHKTVLHDTTKDNTIELPTGYGIISLFHMNNNLIFIGSEYPTDPHLDFKTSYDLNDHQSDCIVTINIDDYKITNKRVTRKHEKVIYANNKKAVTYYKGKYLTYLLDKWEIIDSRSADEIENGGSYTFETCGDYIFVFDNNSGELINTISVG